MSLSRRDALRLFAVTAGALWWLPRRGWRRLFSPKWGRVAQEKVVAYAAPSFQAPRRGVHWQDEVLPLDGEVLAREPKHNPVWFRLKDGGYVHSGGIQPVDIRPQTPRWDIPQTGLLAEVSVPYTDAFIAASRHSMHMYRLYYATTHWVMAAVRGRDDPDEIWYLIQDDKWDLRYYAPARHLRIIPEEEVTPLSPDVPPQAKRIVVDLANQVLMALEYGRVVFLTRVATGAVFSTGDFRTPTGIFITAYKRPSRHMARNNLARNGYDLPGVPWVSYLTLDGLALHGTYWHNDYGKPRSHGCINMTPQAAKWIYRWTLPVVPYNRRWAYDDQQATYVEITEEAVYDATGL